jgi:hypothetical protein
MSWGPPHAPYQTAPEKYRKMFTDTSMIFLRPNVPESLKEKARQDLAGYYAHTYDCRPVCIPNNNPDHFGWPRDFYDVSPGLSI